MSISQVDKAFIELAFQIRDSRNPPPPLTSFRVVAILVYNPLEKPAQAPPASTFHGFHYVVGTNTETGFLGSSICAERSAGVQLALLPHTHLIKIYLVADTSEGFLSPGLMCREFLTNMKLPPYPQDCPIVMATQTGPNKVVQYKVSGVRALFPHPFLYLQVHGTQLAAHAEKFSRSIQTKISDDPRIIQLYQDTIKNCARDDRDGLHCLRLAAGALLSDGSRLLSHESKLGEFGFSLDPVTKMLGALEDKSLKGVYPRVLIQVDQWGVLHAPFASARSHLEMSDLPKNLTCIVHNREGRVETLQFPDLIPETPKFSTLPLVQMAKL